MPAFLLFFLLALICHGPSIAQTNSPFDDGQPSNWPTLEWQAICNPNHPEIECDLSDPRVEAMLEQLKHASRRLEHEGLLPPLLPLVYTPGVGLRYQVATQLDALRLPEGRDVSGYYWLGNMYVEYVHVRPDSSFRGVPTHELFHAIQDAYGVLGHLSDVADSDWIIEGTATAMEMLILGSAATGRNRFALDLPIYRALPYESVWDDYVVHPFWAWIAQRYGGASQGELRVFDAVFREIPNYIARRTGLDVVDGALRVFDPDGLWSVYPQFIAEYGNDSMLYRGSTAGLAAVGMPPGLEEDRVRDLEGSVRPVAAVAYRLGGVEYDLPALGGNAAEVEIRLTGPDADALHLVVEDRAYNTEETGADGERNVFRETISQESPEDVAAWGNYFVRVVNVARDPASMQRRRDFRLRISLYREFVHIGGDVWSSGPSPDEIDSPIRMDMEPAGIHLFPLEPTSGHSAAGYSDLCVLNLHFRGAHHGDGLTLSLHNDGPIRRGEFQIATVERAGPKNPYDYPGQFAAAFELGAENVVSQGYHQNFVGIGGSVEIEEVTPRWIVGRARIAGLRQSDGEWTDSGYIEYPGDLGQFEVEVSFSVRHGRPAGADDILDVRRCVDFVPPPPPPPPPAPEPEPEEPDPEPSETEATPPEDTLAANSQDPSRVPQSEPDVGDVEPSENAATSEPLEGFVPYLSLTVTGALTGEVYLAGDELEISGGCFPGAGLIVAMSNGAAGSPSLLAFAFATAAPLLAGETGSFVLPDVRLTPGSGLRHGPARPHGDAFAGPGQLTIIAHERLDGPPLIRGHATASLRDRGGNVIEVDAEFAVPADCPA